MKYIELKHNDQSNRTKFGLASSPKLRKYFLDYMFHFLLLPYSTAQTSKPAAPSSEPTAESSNGAVALTSEEASALPTTTTPSSEVPACMSEAIYKRFKADINLDNGDELEKVSRFLAVLFCQVNKLTIRLFQMKIGILKFLAFDIYESEEILFHFIVSTSDTRYSVVQVAELHIKRIVGSVDLNNAAIVGRAFHIFLGDKTYPKQDAKSVS